MSKHPEPKLGRLTKSSVFDALKSHFDPTIATRKTKIEIKHSGRSTGSSPHGIDE